MGFLKKLQDEHPDDGVSDELGADAGQVPVAPVAETDPGATAKPETVESAQAAAKPEVVPTEVVKLELMLKSFDWWGNVEWRDGTPYYPTNEVRDAAKKAIAEQLGICERAGYLEDARNVWGRYAPSDYPIPDIFIIKQFESAPDAAPGLPARRFGEPFSDPYNRRLFTQPSAAVRPAEARQDAQSPEPHVRDSGAVAQTDLLSKALSAPFAITAAAGSLIVAGLQHAGNKVRGFYVKGRENGHAILGQQLDEAASRIVQMTDELKSGGMADLIAEMRATGRPAREVFQGMTPGGPHQNLSDRFSALMRNDAFAQKQAKLEDMLSDFGFKASQYAQMGVELNRDFSEAIERNVEKISAATEGFIFKRDGVVKHLQELARSISETISNMINNLFGRQRPQ